MNSRNCDTYLTAASSHKKDRLTNSYGWQITQCVMPVFIHIAHDANICIVKCLRWRVCTLCDQPMWCRQFAYFRNESKNFNEHTDQSKRLSLVCTLFFRWGHAKKKKMATNEKLINSFFVRLLTYVSIATSSKSVCADFHSIAPYRTKKDLENYYARLMLYKWVSKKNRKY